MENLKRYSEDELSLRIFNEEWLYTKRHDPGFIDFIKSIFIVTDKQVEVLVQDLKEDLHYINQWKAGK